MADLQISSAAQPKEAPVENEKLIHSLVRLLARQELLVLALAFHLDQKQLVTKDTFLSTFKALWTDGAERITDQIWLRIQQDQDADWGDLF